MSGVHVEALYCYPIKSCGPVVAETFEVGTRGLQYDREWVLTRPNGSFISQRTNPELALVQTELRDDDLLVTAPKLGELAIPLAPSENGSETVIDIFKKSGTGIDQGDKAANYFSDYIGKPVRLWRSKQSRTIKPECQVANASTEIAFADGFELLLTSLKSLSELNKSAVQPLNMLRFRPNVVVDGPELEPYDEDYWRLVNIGRLRSFVVRACARCPIPNVDQSVGVLPKPVGRIATQALREVRLGVDPLNGKEEVFFGQNLTYIPKQNLNVSIGDPVQVVGRASKRNFEVR